MIFPAIKTVNTRKLRTRARGELQQMETYIDSYKAKLGHYPPDNPGPTGLNQPRPGLNQLYYELAGTTNAGPGTPFVTIDRTAAATPSDIAAFFGAGVAGFVNSTRPNAGDEAAKAQKILGDLKPAQVMDVRYTGYSGVNPMKILVCTVPGVDPNPAPLMDANNPSRPITLTSAPWCYNSSNPTNNSTTYDLWVNVLIDGKTNRICNWSSQILINPH